MSILLSEGNVEETSALCSVYAETIMDLMASNPMVIEIEADLGRGLLGPVVLEKIQNEFPDQFVNCGIQEANMIGVAAGMSLKHYIPFVHTFAAFASRRALDQTFLSGSYSRANIRIIGSDPGVAVAFNGGTHMPFEDIAAFRAIPEMTILEPSDAAMLVSLMHTTAAAYGMFYIRICRRAKARIYRMGSEFVIGKAVKVREGTDATIIASGIMVPQAIQAASMLGQNGISVRVLDMFTLKPLDQQAVVEAADETGAIVTAENHNVINGLGSAVADVLAATIPTPLEKIGVQDVFGEVGSEDYLKTRYHLTAEDIVLAVRRVLQRKREKTC